jgi:predicted permease
MRQRRFDADLAEEIEFHRAMTERHLEDAGLAASEAERASRCIVGNTTRAREDSRAVWIWPWLEGIWQDAAYAARNLRRQPGFTAVVVLVLGTVIGLHTTLATVLAGAFMRPWPGIKDPSGIVALYRIGPNGQAMGFSLADHRRLVAGATSLGGLAAMASEEVRLGAGDSAKGVGALLVSGNFFELLGVDLVRGRGFTPTEDQLGAPQAVAVLTYDLWHSRFGGDDAIVGGTVRLNDVPFTVVGIASREFGSAEPAYGKSLFLPIAAVSLLRSNDASVASFLYRPDYCCSDVVGRLAPGATRERARAELDVLSRDLYTPADSKPRGIALTDTALFSRPGRGDSPQPRVTVALVSAALLLVWLIACANIGNLLLARAAARVKEIGIRLSLGASRGRLVRQLLTEGLVVALAAGALGVVIAGELPHVILRLLGGKSAAFPFRVTPDGVVLGYAIVLAGMSAIAFGLAPALHATRGDLARALGTGEGLATSRFSLRGMLLGLQVAVSVILLVSAALLVRSAQRQAGSFDPGFAVDDVAVVSFELPPGAYDDARKQAFFSDVAEALRNSRIAAFGFASFEPTFIRRGFQTLFRRPGQTAEQASPITYVEVSPGYLNVLRIPILAGRDFEPADAGRRVAVINETMARQYWPNENPVGQTFLVGRAEPQEIVGVMRNAHTHSMYDVPPLFYQPLHGGRQVPKLLLRASGAAVSGEIARIVDRLDPRVRTQTSPLSANLEQRLQEARWGPILAGVLGAFALALATVGMFGVFAYAVRQRTREIGIRMALGAQPSAVVRLVLAGHSRAVVAGLVVGALGAGAASVILRNRLHGLSPFDPLSYLGVVAVLAVAGLAASYVPARRATRVDPVVALRYE